MSEKIQQIWTSYSDAPLIQDILKKNYGTDASSFVPIFDKKHEHLNSKLVEENINKKVKSIGKLMSLSEENIKKKLLEY